MFDNIMNISLNSLLPWTATGLISTLLLHKKPLRGDVGLVVESAFFGIICVSEHLKPGSETLTSIRFALSATLYHIFTIVVFTVVYRLSPFHPLARFPGPLVNKITSLKLLYIVYTGKRHLIVDELHKTYGKIVRTGPNTLSINSHAAISPIYASSAAWDKSDAYIPARSQGDGLFFIRAKDQHNARRRLWATAFTPQSLERYKPLIERRIHTLKDCMRSRSDPDGVVDLGECIRHWSYDVMGDLTFGGSNRLELMEDGDPSGLVESGQIATVMFEVLGEVPSLFDILWYLPISAKIKALESFAGRLLIAREKDSSAKPDDIASHLLGLHSSLPKLDFTDRRLDSLFAIQAGSDTTSGVLTFLFYLLISNKEAYNRLRDELDENFSDSDQHIPDSVLAELPFLNAVIDESLRLGTPFPGLPRVVPKDGAILENTYIPGGTIVGVPAYAQETSEENFYPEPLAYKPERWLPDGLGPGSRVRKGAIMSFSFGSFGCLGKSLAIQEIRIITARLLLAYDLSFAPTFDQGAFMAGVTNMRTTIFRYPLKVVANPRKE